MRLTPLLVTAAAVALIGCPAFAQSDAAPAPAATAAAPATSAPASQALPSIPRIVGGTNIYSTLKASGQFTLLIKAADQSGMAAILEKYPNLTLFAPTDAAFRALPADVLAKLMAPGDAAANQLQQILKYHLVNAQVDSSKIKGAKGPVATVESTTLLLDGSNPDDLMVNNADIIQADVRTSNGGIVQAIDKVLIPADSPYEAELKSTSASADASASPAAPPPPAGG
ncbi:MAG TPA: fasciclin domain-containing protein [Caulobacteraceae bacterium]|nr:fasciclin domain-containing protein [Caulobacteraceae bacterium]